MKKIVLCILGFGVVLSSVAQSKINSKKYPSLFWEITGKGLSRPSYLFGTMHVSSKMVFHLPDSFYFAIRNVDVVALETNPESWQEDLVKYEVGDNSYRRADYPWNNFRQMPADYLNIRSLQLNRYEKQIEAALYSRPSTINNLLYRNYSDYTSDFEENTYLDMYIYQVGKKLGKRVAGVEKYDESMKLMMEAYRDAAKDKNHKQRSFDSENAYTPDRLQEAYRTGNLDLLDSINKVNSFSAAFDEKFLYQRNLLQANSIDSILRSGSCLFVGVGAAHLPGNRGVIEILRRFGYRLRPVVMGEKDSWQKDAVEKLHVPVAFTTQVTEDSFLRVDVPGKFYRFGDESLVDQLQYADMANGAYYIVTRIKTNGLFLGDNESVVGVKIDSLLYENIPGKILTKHEVARNGYKGLDIVNRTRRGDIQRYQLFITPFEVVIFKMSGNGDYVKNGLESKKFFESIRLKEYHHEPGNSWKRYQPVHGGFSVDFPHEPFVSKDDNWRYEAQDIGTGTSYAVFRTDIHNYDFAEEDTFDLGLLDESFSNSDFIDKRLSRKLTTWKGYPALDCKYQHKDGSLFLARFIIQGPHYYTLLAHGRKENDGMKIFLNSFNIIPVTYGDRVDRKDTSMFYSVRTTFYPQDKKIKLAIPDADNSAYNGNDADDSDDDDRGNGLNAGDFRNSLVENDTTGEKIYVSFYRTGRYYYNDDSAGMDENRVSRNGTWIVRNRKNYKTDGWLVTELQLSDTNSSRLIFTKSFYKSGVGFLLATEGDTLTTSSSFVKSFFETFTPSDTLQGFNPFVKKSPIFFNDFFGADSNLHTRAVKAIGSVRVDASDFEQLKKAIEQIGWSDRRYLSAKKSLIDKLGHVDKKECSDFLKQLYYAAADTVEIQYAVLESLLQQQTQYAFSIFSDIISVEPPVLQTAPPSNYSNFLASHFNINLDEGIETDYGDGDFWDELYDSLRLTRTILPGILPLLNLDDYKWRTMRVLGRMVDSNLVTAGDYNDYFSKFFIEAKQELKKQAINEKKKLIKEASDRNSKTADDDDDTITDPGNDKLELYAKLLMPFWSSHSTVPLFFERLLLSNDNKIKYGTMRLLVQNNKPVPDSLFDYFASMDDYRYSLYNDLEVLKNRKLFPAKYDNKVSLARSKLLGSNSYGRPDSVEYLDKLALAYEGRQGYIYFFRYRGKKDDLGWKIATVGLVSGDPKQFDVKDTGQSVFAGKIVFDNGRFGVRDRYDFTSFTETRVDPDQSVSLQINKELKKILTSRRKSAKEFFDASKSSLTDILRHRN